MINKFFTLVLILFFHISVFAEAYVFNVGHGSFAVVKNGNDVVVIDCGSSQSPINLPDHSSYAGNDAGRGDYVRDILNSAARIINSATGQRILVISHMHVDHYNKIGDLKGRLNRQFTAEYIGKLDGVNADQQILDNGNLRIDVKKSGGKSGNKHNIMVKVTTGGKSYLFMGDADYDHNANYAADYAQDATYDGFENSGVDGNVGKNSFPDVDTPDSHDAGFFNNVSLFVAPHHGSATCDSMKWLGLVKQHNSGVAPLTIISGKTGAYNNMPSQQYLTGNYFSDNVSALHPFSYANARAPVSTSITKHLYSTNNLHSWPNDPADVVYCGYSVE